MATRTRSAGLQRCLPSPHLELSWSSTPSSDLLLEIWKRRSMTRSATSYRHTYLRQGGSVGGAEEQGGS